MRATTGCGLGPFWCRPKAVSAGRAGRSASQTFSLAARKETLSWHPRSSTPGAKAPRSGQYEIIGQRGAGTGVERTVVRNEPMPPTPKPGQTYRLVDPTKH